MSATALSETKSLLRLDFASDPELIVAACESMMHDQMPAIIFEDKILEKKITDVGTPTGFDSFSDMNTFYDEFLSEHLYKNGRRVATILSSIADKEGERYKMVAGDTAEQFYGIEMDNDENKIKDLGLHLDSHGIEKIISFAFNTIISGEAVLTAGHGTWLPKSKKYTVLGAEYFKPETLGVGSIVCFVLGGPATLRPVAHDFITTSEGGRVINFQNILGF